MIDPRGSVHPGSVAAVSSLADPDVLAAARGGDPEALGRIAREWMPTILGWCRRIGGASVVADDAAQDVMLVVLRRLDQVPDVARLRPWLFAVTRRVLADHRKRAWIRRWLPGLSVEPADPRPDPELRCALSEGARAIQAVLDEMPTAEREVFVLCDVEGTTDEEAAAIVGVPVGTAKSRLRRARARFSAAFAANSSEAP